MRVSERYEHYIPVVLAALAVLILGCWNPRALQTRNHAGQPSGYPSYLWLSLCALLVGVLAVWLLQKRS